MRTVCILTLAEHAGSARRGGAAVHSGGIAPIYGTRQGKECTTMKNTFPSAVWVVLAPFWPLLALGLAYAAVYATRM